MKNIARLVAGALLLAAAQLAAADSPAARSWSIPAMTSGQQAIESIVGSRPRSPWPEPATSAPPLL
jgi:hypothetical protein